MIIKFSKYLLAVAFVHIVSETHAVRGEYPIEYSRGCYFRETVYPIQIKWTKHDNRCFDAGTRAILGDLPHFNWKLVRKERTNGTAHCDMCGKGMEEVSGRTDTFTWQYYMKHVLHAGELLVGEECKKFMEKIIEGDYEIRDAIDDVRSRTVPAPEAPRRSLRRK